MLAKPTPHENRSYQPGLGTTGMQTWQWVGAVLFAVSTIGVVIVWFENGQALIDWKRDMEPMPYFALLALAGTFGVPTTPFYILAGVLFGPWIAILGSACSVLGYQTLSYGIARGPLRLWTNRLRTIVEHRTPHGWLHKPAARIALVRVMPGLPGALKNYVAASVGATLPVYLVVSWPLGFIGASALIVLGDSLATKRPAEALLALIIALPIALIAYQIKRKWKHQACPENAQVACDQAIPLTFSRPPARGSLLSLIDRRMAGGQK